MSPWVRYDDTFHDDPRVIGISLAAVGLLNVALVWASRHLTDGWVSQVLVRQRAGRAWQMVATELMTAELWTPSDRAGLQGYQIAADLVALQKSKVQVLQERADARERQQQWRARRTPVVSQRDKSVTNADVTRESHDPGPTRPDPEKEKSTGAGASGSARRFEFATHAQICLVYSKDVLPRYRTSCEADKKAALKEALASKGLRVEVPDAVTKAMNAVERVAMLRNQVGVAGAPPRGGQFARVGTVAVHES